MADNTPFLNASSASVTFADDDIAGVHYPRVKLSAGPDGSANDIPTIDADNTTTAIQYMPLFGVGVPGSGGPTLIGNSTNPFRIDPVGTSKQPVTIADNDNAAFGSTTDGPAASNTATATYMGKFTRFMNRFDTFMTNTLAVSVSNFPSTQTVNVANFPTTQTVALTSQNVAVTNTPTVALSATINAGVTAKTGDFDTTTAVDTVTMFGIALPGSGGAVIGGTSTNPFKVDPSGVTAPVSVSNFPATQTVSLANNNINVTNTPAVTVSGTATVDISGTPTANSHKNISAASTNATSVKTAAGTIFGIEAFNVNASPRYLKLYDKTASPSVGTDTPLRTYLIPGNTSGAGFIRDYGRGLKFTAGIAYALTAGMADTDATTIAANDVALNLDYI